MGLLVFHLFGLTEQSTFCVYWAVHLFVFTEQSTFCAYSEVNILCCPHFRGSELILFGSPPRLCRVNSIHFASLWEVERILFTYRARTVFTRTVANLTITTYSFCKKTVAYLFKHGCSKKLCSLIKVFCSEEVKAMVLPVMLPCNMML